MTPPLARLARLSRIPRGRAARLRHGLPLGWTGSHTNILNLTYVYFHHVHSVSSHREISRKGRENLREEPPEKDIIRGARKHLMQVETRVIHTYITWRTQKDSILQLLTFLLFIYLTLIG